MARTGSHPQPKDRPRDRIEVGRAPPRHGARVAQRGRRGTASRVQSGCTECARRAQGRCSDVLFTVNGSSIDRSKLMKRAAAARKKGRYKKAIALYSQVLDREPHNPEIHLKLAPLLVRARRNADALASYKAAATEFVRKGFTDRAAGLLRGAAAELPREAILWKGLANLELERGRRVDAVAALVEGRRHLRSRAQRADAIGLLVQARRIDRNDFAVSYDLACLLARSGVPAQALQILEELAHRPDRHRLARVRARQFWIAPAAGSAWRCIRAFLMRR